MNTDTGPVNLRAEYEAENINLKWYNDNTRLTVPNASNSCTYDTAISLPTDPVKPGYKFKGWNVIPGTPVEYIQSTGSQYIDTGFKFTGNIVKYELKYNIPSAQHSVTLFGASDNNVHWSGLQYYYNDDGVNAPLVNALYVGDTGWAGRTSNTQGTTYQYSLTINRNNLTWTRSVNGVQNLGNFTGIVTNSVNIVLFAHNMGNGRIEQRSSYKNYGFKITQDGVLVRDYIPIKDYNNVPCMYDRVSKQCFYNAGTGDFTAGPEI